MTAFLFLCEAGCGRARQLLMRVRDRLLCAACWRKAGEPPPPPETREGTFQREQETRERMTKRGGTDRYRALAGKS